MLNIIGYVTNNKIIYYIILIMFIPMATYGFKKYTKKTMIGATAIAWQIMIIIFSNIGYDTQKTNTIVLVIVFICWIVLDEKNSINIGKDIKKFFLFYITTVLIITDLCGFYKCEVEVEKRYSDSNNTAIFINKNLEKESIFVCTNIVRASSIVPYVNNMIFINPLNFKEFTYITWDEYAYEKIGVGEVIEKTIKMLENKKNVYLIESVFSTEENEIIKYYQDKNVLTKALYMTDLNSVLGDEAFRIYKFNL